MQPRRKIVGILLFVALVAALIFLITFLPSGPRDLDIIKKKGELRVAIRMNQIDFMPKGDTLAGFQYELADAFAKSQNLRLKWVRVQDVSEAILLLEKGKVDLIAQNIPRTTEVLNRINISSPTMISKSVLVQRKAVDEFDTIFIRSQLDLGKKQLYVVRGSSFAQRIKNLSEEIGDTIFVSELKVHDAEELILLIAKGSIRYGVCDEKVANYFVKRFPGIDVSLGIGFSQIQGWGVSKSTPKLATILNKWLLAYSKSDKYNFLYAKYYN